MILDGLFPKPLGNFRVSIAWYVNWFTDDFFSRFSDPAGMLMIMTRWHVDDPIGRWMERFPETKILRYMAIATETRSIARRVRHYSRRISR
jgi:hypothetical protein